MPRLSFTTGEDTSGPWTPAWGGMDVQPGEVSPGHHPPPPGECESTSSWRSLWSQATKKRWNDDKTSKSFFWKKIECVRKKLTAILMFGGGCHKEGASAFFFKKARNISLSYSPQTPSLHRASTRPHLLINSRLPLPNQWPTANSTTITFFLTHENRLSRKKNGYCYKLWC